jgi:hypothetical protein
MVELLEADIETAFRLVDMVEAWPSETSRLAATIEEVYASVLARTGRLERREQDSFEPLITELRRAIRLALPAALRPD